ncbi:hypothetical protein ACLE20_04735 [Rhizobium sp. YIM 134829]|uniref:hypothetical protein n=1 Tax=Rhizobium sp. YIM 134829 TaxID=3390453 RepID=UPI0039781A3E
MSTRLPPVDIYRAPFIEPMGHLAMQAAYAEQAIIELCALAMEMAPASQQERHLAEARRMKVTAELRNWSEKFALACLSHLPDEEMREASEGLARQYTQLSKQRHRAIHDAIHVGIDDDNRVLALRLQYEKLTPGSSVARLHETSAEDVATVAFALYDLQQDIGVKVYQLASLLGSV